nr:hypothetical protein [Salinibacter sp.]
MSPSNIRFFARDISSAMSLGSIGTTRYTADISRKTEHSILIIIFVLLSIDKCNNNVATKAICNTTDKYTPLAPVNMIIMGTNKRQTDRHDLYMYEFDLTSDNSEKGYIKAKETDKPALLTNGPVGTGRVEPLNLDTLR